jgi:hypothetical protein
MVLTEDDHFNFLIGFVTNKDLIPTLVRRALADSALLFIGCQLDRWDFRVLFHGITKLEGGSRRGRYAHVGVQIDPEESRATDPDAARRYLESYFGGADISIYWGSTRDFLTELDQRMGEE